MLSTVGRAKQDFAIARTIALFGAPFGGLCHAPVESVLSRICFGDGQLCNSFLSVEWEMIDELQTNTEHHDGSSCPA